MSQISRARKRGKLKLKTVPRNVKKAFAIATFIATSLKDHDKRGDKELINLERQCNNAMKVFSIQVGYATYWDISNRIGDVWVELINRNNKSIHEDSVPILIECMSMLIPPNEFKKFLTVDVYVRDAHIYMKQYPTVVHSTLELDAELNELFGTKAYALQKPKEQLVKVKKQRDKSKKKIKTQKVSKNKLKEADRKAKNRNFLRDRIASAKQNKDAV